MVIYHAVSFYQALTCIVHSRQFTEQECVLMIGTSIKQALKEVNLLERLFNKLICIDINAGLQSANGCREQTTAYFEKVFTDNNIDLTDKDTSIYVGGAQFNFGVYLTEHQIPFYYMEEACGLLSVSEHVIQIDSVNRKAIFEKCKENGLYDGSNPCVQGIVCNVLQQEPDFEREGLIHFDTLKALSELEEDERGQILGIFTDIKKLDVPENTAIVLSQHYANLNMMSFERQALLYGIFFDYFLKGKNILIKKHPYDFMPYDILFPGVNEIKQRFPSEFLPFLCSEPPVTVATISSTGIRSMRSVVSDSMEFDFAFEQFFEPIHKLYFALKMVSDLYPAPKIYTLGINRPMIENLCRYAIPELSDTQIVAIDDPAQVPEGSIFIVDSTDGSCMAEWDVEAQAEFFTSACPANLIFFLNSNEDYIFHQAENTMSWQNIVPVILQKNNLNENRDFNLYDDFNSEVFYLLTKDKEDYRMAVDYKDRKVLDNLEMEVKCNGYENTEQLKIAVLEGILEATQKRLLHYIERCKELEKNARSGK